VAVGKYNINAMIIFVFLRALVNVLCEYFNVLEEESVRDNFVITYELLDEMMDNGYPQASESRVLKEFIKSEASKLTLDKVHIPDTYTTGV